MLSAGWLSALVLGQREALWVSRRALLSGRLDKERFVCKCPVAYIAGKGSCLRVPHTPQREVCGL